MDSDIDELIQSPIFKFTLKTPDGNKDLQVHSGRLAAISPVLKAMMETPMAEGTSKHATLAPHVDFDSFNRLCQFAYLGKYSDPQPCQSSSEGLDVLVAMPRAENGEEGRNQKSLNAQCNSLFDSYNEGLEVWVQPKALEYNEEQEYWVQPKAPKYNNANESSDLNVRQALLESRFDAMEYSTEGLPAWSHEAQVDPEIPDYTPIFIGHAKLYSVAKFYMCESLCSLVLYKMHKILKKFRISSSFAVDALVELVEHIYDDEYLNNPAEEKEPFLHLVTMFAATKTTELGSAPRFMELLGSREKFGQAYWSLVCQFLLRTDVWIPKK